MVALSVRRRRMLSSVRTRPLVNVGLGLGAAPIVKTDWPAVRAERLCMPWKDISVERGTAKLQN
jgi:hypothetical protein